MKHVLVVLILCILFGCGKKEEVPKVDPGPGINRENLPPVITAERASILIQRCKDKGLEPEYWFMQDEPGHPTRWLHCQTADGNGHFVQDQKTDKD